MPNTTVQPVKRVREALQPGRFRHWLSTKQPDEVVGVAHNPTHCPIAEYLREAGITFECVAKDGVLIGRKAEEYVVEPWHEPFIRRVDAKGYGNPITVEQARRIFDSVMAGGGHE